MGRLSRIRYRFGQFWQGLTGKPLTQLEKTAIEQVLTPQEVALFERQPRQDQVHSYRVMVKLRESGYEERELLAAALLHDVGKTAVPTRWWDRSIVVMGQTLTPKLAARWSAGEASGWSRPFVVKARHAEWGAIAARDVKSSTLTVGLIRHHQDGKAAGESEKFRELLALLQWADDQN